MMDISIPGFGQLRLEHLVLDYNGTLAVDGRLVPGVDERLAALSQSLVLHVVTADTFGSVQRELGGIAATVHVLSPDHQDKAKQAYVRSLGSAHTAAVGNGRNDCLMLQEAALGIGILLNEGASGLTLAMADVVCTAITDALDLLRHPLRLIATLRC